MGPPKGGGYFLQRTDFSLSVYTQNSSDHEAYLELQFGVDFIFLKIEAKQFCSVSEGVFEILRRMKPIDALAMMDFEVYETTGSRDEWDFLTRRFRNEWESHAYAKER